MKYGLSTKPRRQLTAPVLLTRLGNLEGNTGVRKRERGSMGGGMDVRSKARPLASKARPLASFAASRLLVSACLAAAGVGLLAASAWASVPFFPVPMTMETLAVLLIGGALGPKLGVAAVASYLALGMAGAPVFHNGTGGLAVLLGPTGGYLVGFLAMAAVMGLAGARARARGRSCGRGRFVSLREAAILALGAVLAEAVLYAVGLLWLALELGHLEQAVEVGLVPFLLGDALKAAVAVAALVSTSGVRLRLESRLF